MGKWAKVRRRILSGEMDQNIRFAELVGYLKRLGFSERIRGDHHILYREGVEEILNLQPRPDGTAKPYQVKQVRGILLKYNLGGDDD
ncbi:MAG: type II toxin-antitoxin system HicA family toxin [Fimbriimonadales bacterium]|nr:type II toxin-antitoxin system HicA family toxin [Fimbriimonadales bacterium]